MLSVEKKRRLEDIFYMEEDVPVDLDEEEREYWYELERQWNQTLSNIYGKIARADKGRR